MANFTEIFTDTRIDVDGADQRTAYRMFEYDGPADSWESEIQTFVPSGSAHPMYPDLVAERFEIDPLIGNARTRVKVYYSNYARFSGTIFIERKVGDAPIWTTTFTKVSDRLLGCLRSRKEVQVSTGSGTQTQTKRVWGVVPFELEDQERIIRKAEVRVKVLTDAQLNYIVGQSGKLHYFGTDTADPTYSSGNWYRFQAPDGIETTRKELSFTYSWLHDPGITTKDVPSPDYAFGVPASGYLRKPWHVQVPIEPDDPTVAANPITFSQFRQYDVGGTNGRGWQLLPGMVVP